jgi:hypothetical protein
MTLKDSDWYRSDPRRCLHPTLRNLQDAEKHSGQTGEEIPIVYLREHIRLDTDANRTYSELNTMRQAKVGKGLVVNGRITRDNSAGGSSGTLNTIAAIPCVDRTAYDVLEDLFHHHLTSLGRHVRRVYNDHGNSSGEEWFDGWDSDQAEAANEFHRIGRMITSDQTVGLREFKPRYYQSDAADAIDRWVQTSIHDFYLMLKPRAGKNSTALLALARIALRTGQRQEVLMLSQWPSAFYGMQQDCETNTYHGIRVACINTQSPGWEKRLADERKCNSQLIVIMSSMQSIDRGWLETERTDEFDANKTQTLLALNIDLALFDESDHGLRTANSRAICDAFSFTKKIWMSGSDLYAMRHLIADGNHYCYNLFNEIEDVISKRIEPRPLIKKTAMEVVDLPWGDDFNADEMSASALSRRVKVMLKTNTDVAREEADPLDRETIARYSRDLKRDLWVDGRGQVVSFIKQSEVEAWFDITYEWYNTLGWPSPADHDHVFWSLPSVSAVYALHNLIRARKLDPNLGVVKHEPLVANGYNNPTTIEYLVNADVTRHGKTIFLTVGKMLRGAKAPWSAVVRWDDYSDIKIGLQLELRGQNTDKPEFYVYDFNLWRAASANYELIRSASKTGADITALGQKLHNLIPMMRKGKFISTMMTWEDVVKEWQHDRISEGFGSRSLIDDEGLLYNLEILRDVNSLDSNTKAKRDDRAGKNAKRLINTDRAFIPSTADDMQELRDRALFISKNLPLLVFITDSEFRDLHTLFSECDSETLSNWLYHVGIQHDTADLDDIRESIPKLFNIERMNHQLFIAAERFSSGEFDPLDISEFARPRYGDVSVPETLVDEILDQLPAESWN